MPELKNAKHEAVLAAYIADAWRIGWRAYQAAYPKASQRAAETAWSRLMKNAEFSARRDELVGKVAEQAVSEAAMDLNEVLVELSRIGRASVRDVVAITVADDIVAAVDALDPRHAAAIQELTVESYEERDPTGGEGATRTVKRVKCKLHPKVPALSELRRHHEPDKHQQLGKDGQPLEAPAPMSELEVARRIAFALELGARAAKAVPARPKPKPKAKSKRKRAKGDRDGGLHQKRDQKARADAPHG